MKTIYLLMGLLVVSLTSLGVAARMEFKSALSGDQQAPRVGTMAKGEATFDLEKSGTEMKYKFTVSDLENVTAAHIHAGKKGMEGGVLVSLFAGPRKDGKFSGVLAEGIITAKDLKGSLEGKAVYDLVEMIESGDTYINVHTAKYPGGELRGQIE